MWRDGSRRLMLGLHMFRLISKRTLHFAVLMSFVFSLLVGAYQEDNAAG